MPRSRHQSLSTGQILQFRHREDRWFNRRLFERTRREFERRHQWFQAHVLHEDDEGTVRTRRSRRPACRSGSVPISTPVFFRNHHYFLMIIPSFSSLLVSRRRRWRSTLFILPVGVRWTSRWAYLVWGRFWWLRVQTSLRRAWWCQCCLILQLQQTSSDCSWIRSTWIRYWHIYHLICIFRRGSSAEITS